MKSSLLFGTLFGIAIAGGSYAGYQWYTTQSHASHGLTSVISGQAGSDTGNAVQFVQAENTATDGGVSENYQDWTVLCQPPAQGGQRCLIAQEIRLQDSAERLVLLSIERQQNQALRATIILTINGRLQNQIGLTIEGTQVARGQFAACDQNSCRTALALPEESIELMRRGLAGSIDLVTEEGQSVRLPLSLSGFTASWTRMGQITG